MGGKKVPAFGPLDARVLIVGEAPGSDEDREGKPFVGVSGQELTRMLNEAGINRSTSRIINVTPYRPPANDIEQFFYTKTEAKGRTTWDVGGLIFGDEIATGLEELAQEIARLRPTMIIALGKTALWALTGETAIGSWRGSMMHTTEHSPFNLMGGNTPPSLGIRVLPTYHPAAILRQWAWRSTAIHDLKRAFAHIDKPWPSVERSFTTSPTLYQVLTWLDTIHGPVACDIETTGRNVSLVGLAKSPTDCLCIPFFTNETPSKSYWTPEDEFLIISHLQRILGDPQVGVIGQNFHYDSQHLLRSMGIYPHVVADTMWMQHVLFPGQPKSLDYLASLYCKHYVYWKDELKDYRKLPEDEQKFRRYNCLDVAYTYEIWETLKPAIRSAGLREQFDFQMSLFDPVFQIMVRGIKVDPAKRRDLIKSVGGRKSEIEQRLEATVGERVGSSDKSSKWYRSPQQMNRLFYEEMGMKPILNRKTQRPTTDWDALEKLKGRNTNPAFRLLCDDLQELGSLDVYMSTFLGIRRNKDGQLIQSTNLDPDGRARCSFNVAGTETMRFSSSENAFGTGMNLENLPRDKLLNVRGMFVPDDGMVLLDYDLEQADLRVVVKESGCVFLQDLLDRGIDVYTTLARLYYRDDTITKADDRRQIFKGVAHALSYVAGPRTIAETNGLHQADVEKVKLWYFQKCPEIPRWHARINMDLQSKRQVRNAWGYRRVYFDRLDNLLTQATAWVGQSTVAVTINKGLVAVYQQYHAAQLLLQNHDSLVMQVPLALATPETYEAIRKLLEIPIPYPGREPLVIPVGLKLSNESWGLLKSP